MSKPNTAKARRVAENPLTVQQGLPQVQLDIKVGFNDLVNVRVTEAQETLSLEREARERVLSNLMDLHTKAQTKLTRLAQKLIDETSVEQSVRELVDRLTTFTGEQHTVKIVNTNASTYHYGSRNEDDEQPEVNLNKLAIIGEIRIFKKNDRDIVTTKRVELVFTDAMKEAVTEIENAAVRVREAEQELLDTKRKIGDLPRMAQRAQAELTKAYLRGELTDTRKMLDTVLATPIKALPMLTVAGTVVVTDHHGNDDDE